MAQGKLITRKEAAEYLGVHPQTIVNMINRGLLTAVKTADKAWWVNKEEVEAIGTVNALSLEKKFDEIKILQSALDEETSNLKNRISEYKETIFSSEEYRKIASAFISYAELHWQKMIPDLKTRNFDILKAYINGKTTVELSEEYGLSKNRVSQINEKELYRIRRRLIPYYELEYKQKENEIIISNLKSENEILERIVNHRIYQEKEKKLSKKLIELDFSRRALNVFRSLGIKTLKELTFYTKLELLNHPNLGKKTLHEIESILKEQGVEFAKLS